MSSNASLERYDGSQSQKSYNNVRRMLFMVCFHCKTIRNAANITANFEKSRSKISHFRPQKSEKVLMNGGILKSQKLLAELPIKLHMSNQQQKSEINCPMNVVFYAQIVFKKRIFQARPAHGVITCLDSACALAGLVRFLWESWFFHLQGGTIPPYCALQFPPFISLGVNRLCISIVFVLNKTQKKMNIK